MATTTFYPDAHTETSSVDGQTQQGYGAGSGVSWATIQSAAGNGVNDSVTTMSCIDIQGDTGSGNWRTLRRAIVLFDTTAITDTDIIASATLSVYGSAKADGLAVTPNLNVFSSAPASNTALVAGDFDSVGTTAFATAISYASLSTTDYNDFALNSSGLANIDVAGVSKFSIYNDNYDAQNIEPTWSSAESFFNVSTADETGTTQDPKLVVTHSTATTTRRNAIIY